MADSKISALPAASVALAGTEVLPIVQSSATKQVTVANLTAGRAVATGALTVTGDATLSTGNLVIGTSGKGIDFSATPGTGTSELLADYEEGTWAPTDTSGASLSFTLGICTYTRVGRMVNCYAVITFPITANASSASIGGFPFAPGDRIFGNIAYTNTLITNLNYAQGSGSNMFLWTPGAQVLNSTMSGKLLIFDASFNV